MTIDNRGTPAPKGAAWRKMVYGTVGDLSSRDQAAAVRALTARHPYLDATRVGVWGWSGGGSNTLNTMFRFPDVFQVGVSVAPVPDQKLYDTAAVFYAHRHFRVGHGGAVGVLDEAEIGRPFLFTGVVVVPETRAARPHGGREDTRHADDRCSKWSAPTEELHLRPPGWLAARYLRRLAILTHRWADFYLRPGRELGAPSRNAMQLAL